MSVPAPHFFLRSDAAARPRSGDGDWRFVLQSASGPERLEAHDVEPASSSERLELLAIVRGLESLDEPARVTIVSSNRSISRSFRVGLKSWRERDWQWERYGRLAPVKNADLWQRIDRAAGIHWIECRDCTGPAADDLTVPPPVPASAAVPATDQVRITPCGSRGRKLRIDAPHAQRATPRPQHEATPRQMPPDVVERSRFGHLLSQFLNLFRISDFVLRA